MSTHATTAISTPAGDGTTSRSRLAACRHRSLRAATAPRSR